MRKTHPKLIAEIGSNHNCNMDRIVKLIQKANELGFWAVKFQLFKADNLFHESMRKEISIVKKRELPIEYLSDIKELCVENDLKFICTPFDNNAVGWLKDWVDYYKISSFDFDRYDLITKCLDEDKDLIFISTGLSTLEDVTDLVRKLYILKKQNVCIMHCVSKYPTKKEESALFRIDIFNRFFRDHIHSIGYSDHTVSAETIRDAISFGADYIELHFDLEDREGWEYSYGHCWTPRKIEKLFNQIDKRDDLYCSGMLEKYRYAYSNFPDTNDMLMKADPVDGLRPRKEARNG